MATNRTELRRNADGKREESQGPTKFITEITRAKQRPGELDLGLRLAYIQYL